MRTLPYLTELGLRRDPSYKRYPLEAKTSSFTVKIRDSGKVFTNLGATGLVTATLPQNAKKGTAYTFAVAAAYPFDINPGAAGALYIGGVKGTDDRDIVSHTIGSTITVVCDGNNDWVVVSQAGEWTQFAASRRLEYKEEFLQIPLVNASYLITSTAPTLAQMALILRGNRNWELQGTNATEGDVTFADGGGLKMETDGSDEDQEIITPHLDTNQSAIAATKWNTNDSVRMSTQITTGSAITAQTIFAILQEDTSIPTPWDLTTEDEMAGIFYDTATANWQGLVIIAGATAAATDLGLAVAANTEYLLETYIDSNRLAHFVINGDELGVSTALTADQDLIPFVGIQADGGAAKHMYLRSITLAKELND